MNFLDLAKKRRSIRAYRDRPVSRATIDRCIEAARLAPSACNSQPWYFIVIDDVGTRKELCGKVFSGVYSMNTFAATAPVIVAVVTRRPGYASRAGGFLKGTNYSLIDTGIACEHFILQAALEGVGTCWLGWFNERAARRLLGVRSGERIHVLISLGYPREEAPEVTSRKGIGEIRKYQNP